MIPSSTRSTASAERGSVSVVAAAALVVCVVLAMLTVDAARALVASARAQAGADAAALAAAQELAMPTGRDPAALAGEYAGRNGGTLLRCDCPAGGTAAVVEVRVPMGPMLLLPDGRSASARARAVVDWASA